MRSRSHRHQHLVGGRVAEAAFHPLRLVRAIPKGMRATADAEATVAGLINEEKELVSALADSQGTIPADPSLLFPSSYISRTNGGKMEVEYGDSSFKPVHR